ncbi:alpha/beta fold hydrolase [Noviherbaspirillum massiliense]|uniref:alpha/beta fold hydrolase n=1 Tax=Noviherbaspirillum massiliense TaxID=1465823 RepID=UPI0002D73F68|nr:alpha/beta hydrolase [Noviherbaspirillum massiliense]
MHRLLRVPRLATALSLLCALFILSGCASTFQRLTDYAIKSDRQRAGLERKEIVLENGLRYVYLEGGQGEALMLLHGFGGNKDNFVRTARYLTPHYRVIVPDHIGFGESSHPLQADYRPTAQAERIRMLAHALGIRSPHLGGNSMGGHIALAYAALYPKEVASLWLLDSGGIWNAPLSDVGQTLAKGGRNPLLVRDEEDYAKLIDLVMNDPPFIPRPVMNILAQERIRNAGLEERIFQDLIRDPIEGRIGGLQTPALIVWGDKDRVIHVGTAEILRKLMPRSEVIVMPGIGHVPMVERPQQSAEDYLRFRGELAGMQSAAR